MRVQKKTKEERKERKEEKEQTEDSAPCLLTACEETPHSSQLARPSLLFFSTTCQGI